MNIHYSAPQRLVAAVSTGTALSVQPCIFGMLLQVRFIYKTAPLWITGAGIQVTFVAGALHVRLKHYCFDWLWICCTVARYSLQCTVWRFGVVVASFVA